MTSSLRDLKVYTSYPHDCSYLEDQEATTLFVDPRTEVDANLYSQLSILGFRRSGSHLYRPQCSQCQACVPTRIGVDKFEPKRNQRRAWKHNQDMTVCKADSIATEEHFQLWNSI